MAKRNMVIVGNWKMNKTISDTKKFFTEFKRLYTKNNTKIKNGTKFGFGVPATSLETTKKNKVKPQMIVASQNVHELNSGAYTGELSTKMIKAAGANSVIIGHSERRQYYGETNKSVNKKLIVAIEDKLTAIVCIGETLEERKSKTWKALVRKQLKAAFKGVKAQDAEKVIIAYEPIWAIGTGVTASSQEAQDACKFVREVLAKIYTNNVAEKILIQYGGSVKPGNIAELMAQPDIDGALVGGASLEAKSFIKLLTLNK